MQKRLFSLEAQAHGKGQVICAWHPQGIFLATCGANKIVNVFNRQGGPHAEIPLEGAGQCLQLEWDVEGEKLAILQQNSAIIRLWDANMNTESSVDTNARIDKGEVLTFIKWAVNAPLLAIGNQKGTLCLYDKRTLKKQSLLGKHTKRITSGAWNERDELVLASEDKQLTLSDQAGLTLMQQAVRGEPSELRISGSFISAVISRMTLAIFELKDGDQLRSVAELSFPKQHGAIVAYEWVGAAYVSIGFESGWMVVYDVRRGSAPAEVFSHKLFSSNGTALAVSERLRRAAMCAGNAVKVVALGGTDASAYGELPDESDDQPCMQVLTTAPHPLPTGELPDESVVLKTDGGQLQHLQWTRDGQILTVASSTGCVYNFLASLPVLASTHGTRYMYLTSLLEVSVVDSAKPDSEPLVVTVQMEPDFAALGPTHVALGMNNHVLFHDLRDAGCPLAHEKEYLGTVDAIHLNADYVAVLSSGRISLEALLGPDSGNGIASRDLPEDKQQRDVSCLALTAEFLIYGTRRGTVTYVYLPELAQVSEFRHDSPVTACFPNASGTRVAFVDAAGLGHLLSPIDESVLPIPQLPMANAGHKILWDLSDPTLFVAFGVGVFSVYLYKPHSVYGAAVTAIATDQRLASPHLSPIMLKGGTLTCQEPNGTISAVVLSTHEAIVQLDQRGGATPEKLMLCFKQSVALGRLSRAWDLAMTLKEAALFVQLGHAAMTLIDLPMATRCYRHLGDAGMVMALQKLEGLEDQHLLSGHLAIMFDDHAVAQDHFLQSSRPLAALEMQRDLLHWEQALKLAKTLAPDQVPMIAREFAKQLEFREQYEQALNMYQRGLGDAPVSTGRSWAPDGTHERLCRVGIAKMSVRIGEASRGVALALEGADRDCCRECAVLLEALKQWNDAARLYEMGEQLDKAAAIYIKTKNWGAVAPLMAKIASPKLHSEFAKAKEAEGSMQEAVTAYERANDLDSVVRLLLLPALEQPDRAMAIVRETKSPQGALLVAQHCQARGDFRGAIEFLVLAKRPTEAFELAGKQDQMEVYTQSLGGAGTHEENQKVALYYEGKADALKAGEFWFACKEYTKALRLFLQCSERAVDQAIEVVGRARSDMLTHQLIDFLMGETDGVPKDPNYIFRLYMALGNYPQAAKTAIIIARQEQELGNYRIAHGILFDTHRELTAQRIRVPQELALNLMLLHSYVLVRPLTKLGDHLSGARMLIRVCKHISRFPMHIVPIMTSTVIECHRSGLRGASFEHATTLMRPEYRSQIGEAYKRKIEAIVRKPGEREDIEEPETPSPFDPNARVAETVLECPSTRNTIPYCIATGRHIVLSDLTTCPSCSFPALYSGFTALIEAERQCPMCQQEVSPHSIRRFEEEEAKEWLAKYTRQDSKPPGQAAK